MKTKTIEFSASEVYSAEATMYAEIKGLRTASALARFALTQHMQRYPLSEAQRARYIAEHPEAAALLTAVQPDANGGKS